MALMNKENKYPGISPDDDRDIQIIEDLASHSDAALSGGVWAETRSLLRDIFFAIVIAVLIVVFVVQPVRVEGESMKPTLFDRDRIFVNKFIYPLREWFGDERPIRRGDIVVLLYPEDPSKSYIKRVIGLPGETVQIEAGRVFINVIWLVHGSRCTREPSGRAAICSNLSFSRAGACSGQ